MWVPAPRARRPQRLLRHLVRVRDLNFEFFLEYVNILESNRIISDYSNVSASTGPREGFQN